MEVYSVNRDTHFGFTCFVMEDQSWIQDWIGLIHDWTLVTVTIKTFLTKFPLSLSILFNSNCKDSFSLHKEDTSFLSLAISRSLAEEAVDALDSCKVLINMQVMKSECSVPCSWNQSDFLLHCYKISSTAIVITLYNEAYIHANTMHTDII